ncbi:MAG: hypothetical protein U0793_20910 [Gemmataceae bacterium]
MSTTIDATFDGAVFRPSGPVSLPANTPVRLSVETLARTGEKSESFLKTAQSLQLDGPPDWASNLDHYLYDEDRSGR